MLIKNLTGLWGHGVERIIKTQHSQHKKLVKLLLAHSATQLLRHTPIPNPLAKEPVMAAPVKLKAPRAVPAPAPGKWMKTSFSSAVLQGGRSPGRMSYWLYLPNRPDLNSLPLVVMLHGCAQTATQFAQSTRMNQLAEEKGFAVLYPQQPATHNTGRCWRWYKKSVQKGGGEVKSVVAIINHVTDRYALDRSRIYIAGISAGAAMANIIAMNHPHLIAAVGLHSGSAFGTAQTPMEGYKVMQRGASSALYAAVHEAASRFAQFPTMPAILIHGREDSIVRPINLEHLAEQFRELHHLAGHDRKKVLVKITEKPAGPRSGNAYKSYEYYSGTAMILKACEVFGLDHAWSGGDGSMRFSEGLGPDASKLMWDFFSRHQRVVGSRHAMPASARSLFKQTG